MPNPVQDALNAARTGVIAGLAVDALGTAAADYLRTGKLQVPGLPPGVEQILTGVIGAAEQEVGAPIFEALISSAMGLPGLGAPGSQEARAVDTIKRAIGFGVGLPLVVGRAEAPLKALLGANLGGQLFEAFRRIPEEMGVNFFLGTALERVFETAVGAPLEEAIAERTRPARLAWQQLRFLVKQHQLSGSELVERLHRLGWRDEDIPLLEHLDRVFISVGELQQLYLDGLMDEAGVRDYLGQLGYTDADADHLVQVYLRRAETAGGDVLRGVARSGYLEDHLTRDQYAAILERLNVPAPSRELELEAADLQKSWRSHHLSVAELKALHASGTIDDAQVSQQLLQLGYTNAQVVELIASWSSVKKKTRLQLDRAQVLSYLVAGILTKADALGRLIDQGLSSADAQLLVDHPAAYGGVYAHPLNEATVVAAYQHEVINHERAAALLDELGVAPAERDLALAVATTKQPKTSKAKAPHKTIAEAQVIEAYKYGLVSSTWAVEQLGALGYPDSDAQLLIAIEDTKLSGAVPAGWVKLT